MPDVEENAKYVCHIPSFWVLAWCKLDIYYMGTMAWIFPNNGTTMVEKEGLRFHSNKDDKDIVIKTEAVFIAIGQIPHNEPFKDIVNLNEKGFIITDNNMATREPGIFAIGDCREKSVRQVITALGDASVAAVSVDRYLRSK